MKAWAELLNGERRGYQNATRVDDPGTKLKCTESMEYWRSSTGMILHRVASHAEQADRDRSERTRGSSPTRSA